MADITLTMEAEDRVSPAMQGVSRAAADMGGAVDRSATLAGAKMHALGNLAAEALKKAAAAVIDFGKSSLQAYMDQEKADRQLSAVLKQLGHDAGRLTEVFKEQATQFQKNLGVSDDMVQGIQTMLLRFGVAPEAIQKTTAAVLDYSAATGTDAESATWALIKAVENGGQGLSRLGIAIDATGDKSVDLAAAVEALGAKFGGAAETDADTMAGRVRKAQAALGDMEESFGGLMATVESKFGVLEKATSLFQLLNEAISGDETASVGKEAAKSGSLIAVREQEISALTEIKRLEAELASERDASRARAIQGEIDFQKTVAASAAASLARMMGFTPTAAPMSFGALTVTGKMARRGGGKGKAGKVAEQSSGDSLAFVGDNADSIRRDIREYEQGQEEMTRIAEREENQRLRILEHAADEERRINDQRAVDMRNAGIAAGQAFLSALGEQMRGMKEGKQFNAGDFAKAVLPMAVAAGVGIASGGASLPYSGLIMGGVGALTQLFHDGGYVEHHAGGKYAGEGSAYDSVPAMLTPGERVLSLSEIARMGGRDGVESAVRGGGRGALVINNHISAMDSQSLEESFGKRGGTALRRVADRAEGEAGQMLHRLRRNA